MSDTAKAGIAYLKINERQYKLKGDLKVYPGNRERESLTGQDGEVHGYKETTVAPAVEGTLTDTGGLSVQDLQDITNGSITVECLNKKVYVFTEAWHVPQSEVDPGEAAVSVRFEAKQCKEVLANA